MSGMDFVWEVKSEVSMEFHASFCVLESKIRSVVFREKDILMVR